MSVPAEITIRFCNLLREAEQAFAAQNLRRTEELLAEARVMVKVEQRFEEAS